MAFIDTNILLRWLLGDRAELSKKAEKLIDNAKSASLLVTEIVASEIVYVLRGTGRDRHQVAEALLLIGRTPSLKYENEELMQDVINLIASTSLDFADCYLLARAKRENIGLETYDKQLTNKYRASKD